MLNLFRIICSWTLLIQDSSNSSVELTFHFKENDSLLTIGVDIQEYSEHEYTITTPATIFMPPQQITPKSLPQIHSRTWAQYERTIKSDWTQTYN